MKKRAKQFTELLCVWLEEIVVWAARLAALGLIRFDKAYRLRQVSIMSAT